MPYNRLEKAMIAQLFSTAIFGMVLLIALQAIVSTLRAEMPAIMRALEIGEGASDIATGQQLPRQRLTSSLRPRCRTARATPSLRAAA